MNNVNNMSFRGIKNIEAISLGYDMGKYLPNGVKNACMVVNLTDDILGKDMTEFKTAANKCGSEVCSNFHLDKNFLHIMTISIDDGEDIPDLILNGKTVKPSHKTLPIFSYIAKLTRRIASMKDDQFVINHDFKYGPDGDYYILPGRHLTEMCENSNQSKNLLDKITSPMYCRFFAKQINSDIHKRMIDYLT